MHFVTEKKVILPWRKKVGKWNTGQNLNKKGSYKKVFGKEF